MEASYNIRSCCSNINWKRVAVIGGGITAVTSLVWGILIISGHGNFTIGGKEINLNFIPKSNDRYNPLSTLANTAPQLAIVLGGTPTLFASVWLLCTLHKRKKLAAQQKQEEAPPPAEEEKNNVPPPEEGKAND